MPVSEHDRTVAETIAAEVGRLTSWKRTWRRVTTLLDYFGASHLTDEVRARMEEALNAAGLCVEPSLLDVERYGTVRLSLESTAGIENPPDGTVERSMLHVSVWQAGEEPVPVEPEEIAADDALLWIDVDVTQAEADPLLRVLRRICGSGISREMVEDLLSADPSPKVHSYASDGGIRNVAAFAVDARERERTASSADESKAGELVFQLVEFLVSSRWVITCWHATTTSALEPTDLDVSSAHPRAVFDGVVLRWRTLSQHTVTEPWTAGDLALLVLYELARTYTPARRNLYAWLELWELDFYRRLERTETTTLLELRRAIASFRERLAALNRTGLRHHPELAWFPDITQLDEAERIDELVDRALRDLRALSDALLGSINLVSSVGSAAQARQAETFQRLLALIAAVLLVPTLVATIFGANTALPWGQRWGGFALMVGLMLLTAAATLYVLRDSGRSTAHDPARVSPPTPEMAPLPSASTEPDDRAILELYDYVVSDTSSRTPELLRIFAASEPLTPEEIGTRLTPNDDGTPLTKQQARAVLRNLGRVQANLQRTKRIGRDVLEKDFSRYEIEGSGRYGISGQDRARLNRHLERLATPASSAQSSEPV